MENETLELLKAVAKPLEQTYARENTEWLQYQREEEALCRQFRRRHAGNRTLIHQVNDLLDAQSAVAECQRNFYFLLGLQMGLALGSVNVLTPPSAFHVST